MYKITKFKTDKQTPPKNKVKKSESKNINPYEINSNKEKDSNLRLQKLDNVEVIIHEHQINKNKEKTQKNMIYTIDNIQKF